MKRKIKVFISYSHDSDEHCERVLALSNQLIKDGLDCILDQYEMSPPEGWPMWMANQIRESDFVLIICTENYYRRTTNQEKPEKGLGVKYESVLTFKDIYDNDSKSTRFIPVLFRPGDAKYRPDPLKGATYYCIDSEDGYKNLYRSLTDQSLVDAIRSELKNPYKYKGPLDPVKDELVCVPRNAYLKQVLEGIEREEYLTILGPNQIGKTTFFHQIKKEIKDVYHCIHFDFQVPPSSDKDLYQLLIDQFCSEVPTAQTKSKTIQGKNPAREFLNFLEEFKTKDNKKIILLFDEIDDLPNLGTFLHTWRMVFNGRLNKEELKRYNVIITGSVDLIKLTIGPNSPFNIAQVLYIRDFSVEESEKLVDEPRKYLDIKIEPEAKKYLLSQLSGHPQMLQHACHILVEKAKASNKHISENHVDEAINGLLVNNSSLDTLKENLKSDDGLKNLVIDVLKGKEKEFSSYKEYSILGAGAIAEEKLKCKIRNKVYETFIENILRRIEEESKLIMEKQEEDDVETPPKSLSRSILKVSFALAIIIGFTSILTNSAIGILTAGALMLIAFIALLITPTTEENKNSEAEKNDQKE